MSFTPVVFLLKCTHEFILCLEYIDHCPQCQPLPCLSGSLPYPRNANFADSHPYIIRAFVCRHEVLTLTTPNQCKAVDAIVALLKINAQASSFCSSYPNIQALTVYRVTTSAVPIVV